MKELEKFLESELRALELKEADWGHLTIEDDSRKRTLLDVQSVVKNLTIQRVINWVACSEREPDKEDTYYVYPDKHQYTAQFHKYGKWAGKWTVDDQNGYEYEVIVKYWKVIEPPCL